ncbi:hypothetical protein BZA02_105172 [Ruegeria sp. P4]|nr:hypothetical protein BZA02_105172 [Ruegeria sp. P4]
MCVLVIAAQAPPVEERLGCEKDDFPFTFKAYSNGFVFKSIFHFPPKCRNHPAKASVSEALTYWSLER